MSSYKQNIGANIRHERMVRNMSIDELAEMLHLSTAFIGLIERGQRGAKLSNLIKIAEIFGLTVNDLIYGTGGTNEVRESDMLEPRAQKNATISSLLYNLNESELDYVIAAIRNLKMLRTDIDFDIDDDAQTEESSDADYTVIYDDGKK